MPPLAGHDIRLYLGEVADAMEATVNPETGKSQEKLLELATIVNAIVYTQGETGIQGGMEKVDCIGLCYPTDISYRKLMPVISALTSKGSGRLEIIRQFFENENYKDIRLVMPLIDALGDKYPEISDFVSGILKQYGQAIIPVLKKKLDIKGGRRDGKIVDIISYLCGREEKEFYLNAIENGCEEVKVNAIKALEDLPECEELLIVLSKDRKKEIRDAALYALGKMSSEGSVKCLLEALSGTDRDAAFVAIKRDNSLVMTARLLEGLLLSLRSLNENSNVLPFTKKSQKSFDKSELPIKSEVKHFMTLLRCMYGRKDKRIFGVLKTFVENAEKIKDFKLCGEQYNIIRIAAENILAFENEEAYDFLVESVNKYSNTIIDFSFEAAIRSRTPEYVFNTYSPFLKKGTKTFAHNEIVRVMSYYCDFEENYRIPNFYQEPRRVTSFSFNGSFRIATSYTSNDNLYQEQNSVIEKSNIEWDKRWKKLLLEGDEISLGCKIVSSGDSACVKIMLEKPKEHNKFADRWLIDQY